jgi:hypothetical protein
VSLSPSVTECYRARPCWAIGSPVSGEELVRARCRSEVDEQRDDAATGRQHQDRVQDLALTALGHVLGDVIVSAAGGGERGNQLSALPKRLSYSTESVVIPSERPRY